MKKLKKLFPFLIIVVWFGLLSFISFVLYAAPAPQDTLALEGIDVSAYHQYTGEGIFTVEAGKSLTIEVSSDGWEIIDIECPAGKQFDVKITVRINEIDVE